LNAEGLRSENATRRALKCPAAQEKYAESVLSLRGLASASRAMNTTCGCGLLYISKNNPVYNDPVMWTLILLQTLRTRIILSQGREASRPYIMQILIDSSLRSGSFTQKRHLR
jgi:hypothetical protein